MKQFFDVIVITNEMFRENTDLPQKQLIDYTAGRLKKKRYCTLDYEIK